MTVVGEAQHPARPGGRTDSRLGARLVVALLLLALTLRPALTSPPPVLVELAQRYHLGAWSVTMLGTLPVVSLGLAAWLVPALRRYAGSDRAVQVGLVMVTAGLLVRGLAAPLLLPGTVVAALGIGVLGVLLPSIVKERAGSRTGAATSLYGCALTAGAALGAALSPWLAHSLGGVGRGLAVWAVVPVLAMAAWRLVTRHSSGPMPRQVGTASGRLGDVLRSPVGWQVTSFFAVQALLFFSLVAWLPSLYRERGADATHAGLLLALFTLASVVASAVIPAWAARLKSQRALATGLSSLGCLGLALVLVDAQPVLTMVLLGLGQGATFPLALTLIALRAHDEAGAAALSAMAQGVGFSVAALGPFIVGWLLTLAGGWGLPLAFLLAVAGVEVVAAWWVGRPREPGR